MDAAQAPSPSPGPPASAGVTATPLVAPSTPLPAVLPGLPVPPLSPLQAAWPPAAQWATAFLLGVATTLLAVHVFNSTRVSSKPTEVVERRAVAADDEPGQERREPGGQPTKTTAKRKGLSKKELALKET